MNRNPKLYAQLSGDGWCNKNADRAATLRAIANRTYEQSKDQQSFPTVFLFDKYAKELLFEGVEFSECSPCRSGPNPFVTRPQSRITIETDRADQVRGLQQLNIRFENDPVLSTAEFYCLDEKRTKCLDEDGQKVEESILPAGTIWAFNPSTHAPIALRGKIQNREANDQPSELWVRTYDCEGQCSGDDSKFGVKMEVAPMDFNRRENTISCTYVAPKKCPPRTKGVSKNACNPCVLECDPEGGLKVVAASQEAARIQAEAIAQAVIGQASSANTEARTQRAAQSEADAKAEADDRAKHAAAKKGANKKLGDR